MQSVAPKTEIESIITEEALARKSGVFEPSRLCYRAVTPK